MAQGSSFCDLPVDLALRLDYALGLALSAVSPSESAEEWSGMKFEQALVSRTKGAVIAEH